MEDLYAAIAFGLTRYEEPGSDGEGMDLDPDGDWVPFHEVEDIWAALPKLLEVLQSAEGLVRSDNWQVYREELSRLRARLAALNDPPGRYGTPA